MNTNPTNEAIIATKTIYPGNSTEPEDWIILIPVAPEPKPTIAMKKRKTADNSKPRISLFLIMQTPQSALL